MKKIINNKYLKTCILFFTLYIVPINSYSADTSSILGDLGSYAGTQGTSTKFVEKANGIIGVVQTAGSVMSIICLIVLGVKYMMGSVEEKAEYKKTLMPYVLGAIMVFSISNILGFIYQIAISLS